jgi:hypothetical protein
VGDFTLPLRALLVSTFRTDAALVSLMGLAAAPARVYDNVPAEEAFPYVRVGDELVTDYGDKSDPGQEFLESIHFFDRSPASRGQKIVNQLQARVYSLLHEKRMTVTGGEAYLIRFVNQRVLTDDGLMWHGVSTYRFLLS